MRWPSSPPPLGLGVAGAALAGAAWVQLFPVLPPAWFAAAGGLAGLWAWWRGGAWRWAGALLLAVAWTCLAAGWRLQARLPAEDSPWDGVVSGQVRGLPLRDEEGLRFDLLVDGSEGPAPLARGSRLRLSWPRGGPRTLAPGSRWRLPVRLRSPRGLLNPGGRDAERQALAQGVVAIGYVRPSPLPRAIEGGRGVDALRDRLSARIAAAVPGEASRFVQALAVGDTRGLQAEDWEVLRATGLTHQIAISGFHVGLAAGFGACLLRLAWWCLPRLGRRWPRPQAAALGALLAAAAYTALAGFALPTLRTLLMIAVLLAARLARRTAAGRQGLALALLGMLAFDPLSVLSAGFWLSFAGVAWLMWCLPGGVAPGLAGAGRSFVKAQAVALLGLLPLTVWFFGQASLPGPLANLLGVPVISLAVVPLALAGVAMDAIAPGVAALCWQAAAALMAMLWQLLQAMAAWPAALAWLPEPGLVGAGLALAGAAWCLLPSAPDRLLAALLFLPLLWPMPPHPPAGSVDIQVLDTGQGLSVLVSTQGHRLLYDTGSAGGRGADQGETVVVPALHALGVARLDLVVVSHDSRDHAGGLPAVMRAWPGVRVIGPPGWARPGMGLCEAGAHWRWDGVDFAILHPPPDFPSLGRDSSCVLRVSAGGHAALLPGDIGEVVQRRLLELEGERLRADLVLAPRHGGVGGADPGFVAATAPRWAVFSAAEGNRSRLPRAEVVEAWRSAGARALVTARTGSLRFRLSPRGSALVEARRRDRPRYWRPWTEHESRRH